MQGRQWGSEVKPHLNKSGSDLLKSRADNQYMDKVTQNLIACISKTKSILVGDGPVSAQIFRPIPSRFHFRQYGTFGTFKTADR